jgi:hypothetical protein
MNWRKGSFRRGDGGAAERGWIRRDGSSGRFAGPDSENVVTTRDYPGGVTSRTIRNDVFEEALRAAESTLRNGSKKR